MLHVLRLQWHLLPTYPWRSLHGTLGTISSRHFTTPTFVVTHIKIKKQHAQEFTDHINSIDPNIEFTTEEEEHRSLAFLDTLTVIKQDGSLDIKIYRKRTHTDQYLNFSSNHPVQHKLGVIQTLYHRANTVITNPADTPEEKHHIDQSFFKNVAIPVGLSTV